MSQDAKHLAQALDATLHQIEQPEGSNPDNPDVMVLKEILQRKIDALEATETSELPGHNSTSA